MTRHLVLSTRVEAETVTKLDAMAERADRSRAWLVAHAVKEFIERDEELMAFLQPGLDEIAAGRVHTREAMEGKFAKLRSDLRNQPSIAAA